MIHNMRQFIDQLCTHRCDVFGKGGLMIVSIGVEHFGKIEKAEITLGRLILFVGENNSGK